MRPVEQTGGITGPELYVKSAAALMGVSLDPAWVADAPEVDGLVLIRAERLTVGDIARMRVERALAYDLLARPL